MLWRGKKKSTVPLYEATFILVKKEAETGPATFGHAEPITVEQVSFPTSSSEPSLCAQMLWMSNGGHAHSSSVCLQSTGLFNSIAEFDMVRAIKMGENPAYCKTVLVFKGDTRTQGCGNDQSCPWAMFQKQGMPHSIIASVLFKQT